MLASSTRVSHVPDKNPPLPDFTRWPSFPFEGDMRVKALADPVAVEPPRSGEDATDCVACNTPDDAYIWVSDRWRVRAMDRPTGLPVVLILECRSHLDLGDLPNLLAAELGVMTVRLERAIRSLDGVARVHVNRWGDGSAHLHMWFLARPYGRLQLRGTFLSLWDDILPVVPEQQWRESLALVAAWLGEFGGRAIAEPPHIAWQAPSTISDSPTASSGSLGAMPTRAASDPQTVRADTADTAAADTETGAQPANMQPDITQAADALATDTENADRQAVQTETGGTQTSTTEGSTSPAVNAKTGAGRTANAEPTNGRTAPSTDGGPTDGGPTVGGPTDGGPTDGASAYAGDAEAAERQPSDARTDGAKPASVQATGTGTNEADRDDGKPRAGSGADRADALRTDEHKAEPTIGASAAAKGAGDPEPPRPDSGEDAGDADVTEAPA
ncbi:hypothetical protein KRM28CT15_01960 [Krasilnikovia sp. M28-CT-15]